MFQFSERKNQGPRGRSVVGLNLLFNSNHTTPLRAPPTRLRYSQLRTKQPSRAKPTTTTTTKRKKRKKKNILNHPFYKLILNHPFCKLILNHPFCKLILNHPFFFFRGLGCSLDFFDPQLLLR